MLTMFERCKYVKCDKPGDYPLEARDGSIDAYCAIHIEHATLGC